MKQALTFLLTVTLLATSSCKTGKPAGTHQLELHKWVLSELNNAPVQMSNTSKDAGLQFNFKEMRIAGNGGCNSIAGTFTISRNKLLFGPVLATKMACDNIKFEDSFLQALAQVNRYEITGSELLLKNGNRVIARLLPK